MILKDWHIFSLSQCILKSSFEILRSEELFFTQHVPKPLFDDQNKFHYNSKRKKNLGTYFFHTC